MACSSCTRATTTPLFLLLLLTSFIAAVASALPTPAATRWEVGVKGADCDDTCAAASSFPQQLHCNAIRNGAVNSEADFSTVTLAVEAEHGVGAGFSCESGGFYDTPELAAPYILLGSCGGLRGGAASACGASSDVEARRICCCVAPSENATALCALGESDCGATRTWDSLTGRCLPPPPPKPPLVGCAVGQYRAETGGDVCATCPERKSVILTLCVFAATVVGITAIAFLVVAVVQTSFGRDVKSGAQRSARFAGWVVSALAAQAQIGRTASAAQPVALRRYYQVLTIFELNPDAAIPTACGGSGGTSALALVAMLISLGCVAAFALLGLPCIARRIDAMLGRGGDPIGGGTAVNVDAAPVDDDTRSNSNSNSPSAKDASSDANAPKLSAAVAFAFHRASSIFTPKPVAMMSQMTTTKRHDLKLVVVAQRTGTPEIKGTATYVDSVDLASDGIVRAYLARSLDDQPKSTPARPADAFRATHGCSVDVDAEYDFNVVNDFNVDAMTDLERRAELRDRIVCYQSGGGGGGGGGANAEDTRSGGRGCGGGQQQRCRWDDKRGEQKERGGGEKKKKKKSCAPLIGTLRNICAGVVFLLHPLVANVAFRSIFCIALNESSGGSLVVAAQPQRECFGAEHTPIFLIAIAAICCSLVGFPVASLITLSVRAGWWNRSDVEGSDDDEPSEASWPEGEGKDPGPVRGGICCRCACCVARLVRCRSTLVASHSRVEARERRNAWSGWTHTNYKPEFFWMRGVFYASISALAFANTFLNPTLARSNASSSSALQALRFALCAAAVCAPCAVLIALLPNKLGSRWKFPLRLLITAVSLAMLALNGVAWIIVSSNAGTHLGIDVLAYIVLALSWLQLGAMVAFFIIFVAFRGAASQKEVEDEEDEKADEDEIMNAVAEHLARRRASQIIVAWRGAVESKRQQQQQQQQQPGMTAAV